MAKILYLENEEILVKHLPVLLKDHGLEVTSTDSPDNALALLSKEAFDAVLLDIMMPPSENMDVEQIDYGRETGIAVAKQIRKLNPKIPIVAFTVLTDPEIQGKMRAAGIGLSINKPSEPGQIADALLHVIRGSKS